MAEEEGSALRSILALFKIGVEDEELKEGHKEVEGFVGTLKEVGKAAAEAFAVHELHEFIEGQVQAATSLKATSIRIGTTTGELQALHLAAGESAVSTQAMDTALRFLNRNIANARDGTGKTAATFAKLGIHLKDTEGKARPAGDVMEDLADAIKSTEDPAKRTQIAMQLLGRGGAELIPVLSKGGAAFEDARKKLKELGGGISEDFIEKAEEAEARTAEYNVAMQGLKSTIAGALMPAFTQAIQIVTKVVAVFRQLIAENPMIQKLILFLGGAAAIAATVALAGLAVSMGAIALEALAASAPFILLGLAIEEILALLTGHESLLQMVFGDGEPGGAAEKAEGKVEAVGKALGAVKGSADGAKRELGGAMKAGEDGAKKTSAALGEVKKGLVAVDEASKSFFGRGGKGQPAHAAIPLNWGKRLPKGAQILSEAEAKPFGTNETERQRANKEFGYGLGAPGAVGKGGKIVPAPTYVPTPTRNDLGTNLAAAGIKIDQKIDNHFEIEANGVDKDSTRAIGDAVGQGVASGTQRANDRARLAFLKP